MTSSFDKPFEGNFMRLGRAVADINVVVNYGLHPISQLKVTMLEEDRKNHSQQE
jgi:hypothetical protein